MCEEEHGYEVDGYAYRVNQYTTFRQYPRWVSLPIWWSTIQVHRRAMVLFSLPFLSHLGHAVFWDGDSLCLRGNAGVV